MVTRYTVLLLLAAGIGALALVLTMGPASGRVTLAQLRRFARRQELLVTPTNGGVIVRALSVTRRWRVLGLVTGLLLGLLWALGDGQLTINFTAAFLGWFVGAIIAEWRLGGLPVEPGRRTASLTRRTLWGYLRRDTATLLGASGLALLALFVVVTLRADGATGLVREAVTWLLAAGAGLVAVWMTLRRVAARPQSGSSFELLAADEALRARSANVLAGSAIVAAGYPAATLLMLIGRTGAGTDPAQGWALASFASIVTCLVVGWLVAVRSSPARLQRTNPPVVADAA